ncbi:sodium:solute symporter family protein [Cytophagales bacterium LB-30]|uniref:Sodium:solute symporter family protein n=1 Tax=Shiella aurantiaca TaxID=3058365 RepID=A0ABT8F2Q8_9BACT|nr:sodium:solute symporter family protein [Shiella aurantiaca]MDN4164737.1 sodium:solute symporter family protein [Shiella aurantiaca]
MHFIDLSIFIVYMLAMLGVGVYFMRKNEGMDDYYVGGRSMGSWHIGLSVVATDVGGGFSIGLGGLGFMMGLSGSWMLFTGLLGAWLAAVFLIPKVKAHPALQNLYTFPQIFAHFYNKKVALAAALISGIGYIGFTSSQILAGAKLASGTFPELSMQHALWIMGAIAIIYTVMGGIKAVIYTDTIQWIILMAGLLFIGIPMSYYAVGGWEGISSTLPREYFSMSNLTWQNLVNWGLTIIPIWFVGMTLYQRIFASRDVQSARKAWFIAGLFEWPIMAFMGVFLGLMAKVATEQGMLNHLIDGGTIDPEKGLPMLLSTILPFGIMGLMLSAYFSAILSTADSCLMAASGNVVSDLLHPLLGDISDKSLMRLSQLMTLLIGILALWLASRMTNVLSLMLYSYAFMVSGLFVPLLVALWGKRHSSLAALVAMLSGGATTLVLSLGQIALPFGLDANLFGISISALLYFIISRFSYDKHTTSYPTL